MADDTQTAHAHQFDDIRQQHEADSLGMWVFLTTEILFFGALFLCY
jgi:cytochrome c oxidase subunit 3